MTPSQFLETFTQSEFSEQNLMCELYFHDRAPLMDTQANPVPCIWDIHLRSFDSFVNNHVRWLSAPQTIRKNEDSSTLCIWGEPRAPLFVIAMHKINLTFPDEFWQLVEFQHKVICACAKLISRQ